jgi:hypothetical protein
VVEQVPEALVRLLGGAEAGELPHRPQPAAVHRGINAAGERERARVAEVAVGIDPDALDGVEGLVLEARDRAEELALPFRRCLVELPAPLLAAAQLAPVLDLGHSWIVPV